MSRRSESRERASVVNGVDDNQEELDQLEKFKANAEAAVSSYNEAHIDDKLELSDVILKKGSMRLVFTYKKLSSTHDLDSRLFNEFSVDKSDHFWFDFRVKHQTKIEAFTPLRNVMPSPQKISGSVLCQRVGEIIMVALMGICFFLLVTRPSPEPK